jgi:hypothetical protein
MDQVRAPPLTTWNYAETVPQPSIEEKGMTTMRLHRLHFSSSPCPHTFAINWPHSQRVSNVWRCSKDGAFAMAVIGKVGICMRFQRRLP